MAIYRFETLLDQIIVGDCLEILPQIPSETIDLVLTSPPYDDLRDYGTSNFDFAKFKKVAQELQRVLKSGGVIVWITADATIDGSETGTSFRQALFFIEIGLKLHDTMIFKKRNPIPQIYRKRYTNEFEFMFILAKDYVAKHNPIMVSCRHAGLPLKGTTYKNFSRTTQVRKKPALPVKSTKMRGNIWEYVVGKRKEDQEAKFHSAPFPVALARDHIYSWTDPGDIVLDPFCGSGTTCKAAVQLRRRFIGIETNPDFASKAIERLKGTEPLLTYEPMIYEEDDYPI
ncbi:MAG: site-specific DNA-methyltransferase [Bacteroidia bacterium]|nr:site-specific DNA-methyltransferase [Bacteroidia bacterium]